MHDRTGWYELLARRLRTEDPDMGGLPGGSPRLEASSRSFDGMTRRNRNLPLHPDQGGRAAAGRPRGGATAACSRCSAWPPVRPDDRRRGRPAASASGVVVLSYGLWQDRFAADPGVLGWDIELDGNADRIVGVMPAGFYFPIGSTGPWTATRGAQQLPGAARHSTSTRLPAEARRPGGAGQGRNGRDRCADGARVCRSGADHRPQGRPRLSAPTWAWRNPSSC